MAKSWVKQFQEDGKQRHRRPSSTSRRRFHDKLRREEKDGEIRMMPIGIFVRTEEYRKKSGV